MSEAKYEVTTWDMDLQEFTPQPGVVAGPHSKWDLRRVLRRLRDIGYDVNRADAHSVLVRRIV
jgi:hypothetical protein